jgi:hypothetical protein
MKDGAYPWVVLPFDQEPLVTSANPRRRPGSRLLEIGASLILVTFLAGCSSANVDGRAARMPPVPLAATSSSSPAHLSQSSSPRRVPAVDVPDHTLTPGRRFPVVAAQVCVPGYASSVRHVTDAEKARVYARYAITWVPYQHEVDHLISLELGGSNAIRNLWPEPYAGRWGARTKDVLENRMHTLVCSGQMSLAAAQHQEATDWVAAYQRYVGEPPGGGTGGTPTDPGGFYASSYPTASTIYCADDPGWHDLSSTYLVHFATYRAALHRFPGYHLHQPC